MDEGSLKAPPSKKKPRPTDPPEVVTDMTGLNRTLSVASFILGIFAFFPLIFYVVEIFLFKVEYYFVVVGATYDPNHSLFLLTAALLSLALLTAFLGYLVGKCRKKSIFCLLFLLVSALSITFAVMTCLWFVQVKYLSGLDERMMNSLQTKYIGEFSDDISSKAWNFIQSERRTCGVKSASDWKDSSWFSSNKNSGREWPVSCCAGGTGLVENWADVSDDMLKSCYPNYSPQSQGSDSIAAHSREQKLREAGSHSLQSRDLEPGPQTKEEMELPAGVTIDNKAKEMFASIFAWEDTWGALQAIYYKTPVGYKLSHKDARETCQKYAKHLNADGDEFTADLAIGFNSEEIDMLLNLDAMRASWLPHLGYERDDNELVTVPYGYEKETRKITQKDNLDFWAPNEPKYDDTDHNDFGCLSLTNALRSSCVNKKRRFFCARYHRYQDFPVKKPKQKQGFFEYTDFETMAAEVHVSTVFLDFDEARNYCAFQYGVDFDLAVGFTQPELQALTLGGLQNGLTTRTDSPFLGIYRGYPHQQVFYSVMRDVAFANTWARYEPEKRRDETVGCVHAYSWGRGDCSSWETSSFTCAFYLKTPKYYDPEKLYIDYKNKSGQTWTEIVHTADGYRSEEMSGGPTGVNEEGSDSVVRSMLLFFIIVMGLSFVAILALLSTMMISSIKMMRNSDFNGFFQRQKYT